MNRFKVHLVLKVQVDLGCVNLLIPVALLGAMAPERAVVGGDLLPKEISNIKFYYAVCSGRSRRTKESKPCCASATSSKCFGNLVVGGGCLIVPLPAPSLPALGLKSCIASFEPCRASVEESIHSLNYWIFHGSLFRIFTEFEAPRGHRSCVGIATCGLSKVGGLLGSPCHDMA